MFLVLVSSRSNFLLLMFFDLLPSKEILVENTKPCSLGNFLNKVDESLCTPLSSFSDVYVLLLTKSTWACFCTLPLNMTSVGFGCIYSMSVCTLTLFTFCLTSHLLFL